MPPLNYQIGVEVVNKAERTLKQLDKSVKQKFKAMAGYQKKFNIQTQLSQQLSRRLLETETMGLSKMQKFYGPVLKDKKGMAKLSDAWHKSESKSLREVTSLMGLSKTEHVKYLKRVGASADEMKRDTTFTKMNKKAKTELSKIETCRGRGLREIGNTVSKTMKMEKEGLVTLSSVQKKQYNDMQRITEGYKTHNTAVGKLKNSMGKLFGTIKKAGMIFLTVLGPLFLVGAALRTLKSAADWVYQPFIKFEDAMYELRKTANLTKDAMLEIGEAISELSLRIPVAAEELAKIAATAGRLGIRGRENILAFTETIAKMSVATILTADEAAEALARIRQAFAIPVANIEYLGSVINELSNTTASNSRDIVAALGNIGAAGKMLGITADEAAAMSATLVASGMAATRSGTRIRRMLTEMARKSEKMAETMEISAEEMKFAIEKDPMEALLMYLKHLSETESKVDKLKEAHEIFGKVGGFAIATLAESYPELIKNLETAREETKWGTSLQREFQIATTKTSAELQILANRTEAARREIGENFIPTLISAKKIGVAFTESLNVMSKVWAGMRGESEKAIVPLSLYEEEWKRLASIAQDPAIEDIARTTKEWKTGFWVSRKELRTLVEEMEKLEPSTEAYNKQLNINAIIQNQNNVAMRTGYEIAKKYGDLESENLKPMGDYNDYLDVRNRIQRNIAASTDETIDKETEFAKLNKIENQLFKDSAKVLVPYLEKKKELELITAEESIQLENLKIYLRTVGKETEVVENATEKLNKMSETYVDTIIEEAIEIKFLTDETKDLVDVTKSLWDEVDTLTDVYSNALEAQYNYQAMEKKMPSIVKNVLSPMQNQIDLAKDLMKAGKDDAAALELATVADQLYAQGLTETNKRRQAAYIDAYKYIDSMTEAISGAPAEVAAAKVGFGKLFEPEPLMVDADFSLFKEKFKTEIEEAYFDKEYKVLLIPEIATTNGIEEGIPSAQHGLNYVPKTALYKLHEGESVLTKKETAQNIENNNLNVNMGGVSLSENYNFKKFMNDVNEYSLSRL